MTDFFDAWVRDYIKRTGQPPALPAIMTFIEACASVRIDHDKDGTYAI